MNVAIINEGGTSTNQVGGDTQFFNNSTAGSATITNVGATVNGAPGGFTEFRNDSSAANAIIVNNGGTNGGSGGVTRFFDASDGGTARAITEDNGTFDISGLTNGGMQIGSIEGSGNHILGTNSLTVGGNNLSTTVSGVISGDGGSLTKVGTGTLTLSGTNTYTGPTAINEGVLSISQDANLGTPPNSPVADQLTFDGGTLQATASFTLNSNRGITLNSGAGIFDVTGSNVLTYGGVITGEGGFTKIGTGTLILSGTNTYVGTPSPASGATAINGGVLSISQDANLGTAPSVATANHITFDGGTLQATASLTLNPNRGITLNSGGGAFDVTASNVLTYGGAISGVGNLSKVGAGTLLLSGSNAYSGATFIQAGVLQAGSMGALSPNSAFTVNSQLDLNGFSNTIGSLAGNGMVTNTGTVPATLSVGSNNTSTTFSGLLQDGTSSLALTKIGSGILTLSGTNTYSGRTTISAGAITTQNASALGTGPVRFGNGTALNVQNLLNVNGDWTVLPGTATVNGGTVQTFGNFNLGGGGTLVANANFTVPGAANINSSGFVVNNVFTVNDSVNLSGNSAAVVNGMIAAASVNVNNTSSLVVNNPGTVAANVNVGTSARLGLFGRINGDVVNAGVFAGTGFAGTGRVSGNVTNNGLISPGSELISLNPSIGRLTIGGNFTQNANGTLRIEVEGPGRYDVLAVGGRANLGGRLQLVRVGNFQLRVGDQIAFLTAGGGVSGTFANVENDFLATGSIIVFDVVYLPNMVVLEGTQGSFARFAAIFCGTPNAIAVGQALNSAVGDPRAAELIGFLNQQTLPDLCEDIFLISPEQLTSIFVIGTSLANVQTANLQRRMGDIRAGSTDDDIRAGSTDDDIRAGSTDFSTAGFYVNGSGPSFWEGFTGGQGFAGVTGVEGKSGPSVFAPIPQNRWGAFVTGIGEFTNVESTFNASGYDLATGGFTMGVDYRIGSNFAIGLTGGYAYTGADLVNDSSISVNGGKLGLYATAFGSGFYLDTAVIGGLNGYDTRRTALEGTARGETIGGDLNVLVAAGYDWKAGGWSIGPTASFQYTLVGFDSFSESGSLAPLAYPSQNADSYRTAFGMRASYDWKIGPVLFIPEVRAAWQHEFGDTDYSLVSSFANGAGDSFTVTGPEIGRDSLLLSAGFAVQWSDRITTYAYYDGELFRTNYLANNVSVGVRINF